MTLKGKTTQYHAFRSKDKEWILWHVSGVSGHSLLEGEKFSGKNFKIKKSYEDIQWQNISSNSRIMILIYKRKVRIDGTRKIIGMLKMSN